MVAEEDGWESVHTGHVHAIVYLGSKIVGGDHDEFVQPSILNYILLNLE